MVKSPVTHVQRCVLEHLCQVAIDQHAKLRQGDRHAWDEGWSFVAQTGLTRCTDDLVVLIGKGFVVPCCEFHGPHEKVRITKKGVELLEKILGEPIYA